MILIYNLSIESNCAMQHRANNRMTELTRPSTLTLRAPANGVPRHRRPETRDSTRELRAEQPLRSASPETSEPRVVRSDALLQGRSHVSIVHNGETYQLRATRLGKLILTK